MINNFENDIHESLQNSQVEKTADIRKIYDLEEETECQSAYRDTGDDIEDLSSFESEEDDYDVNLAVMTLYYLKSQFKKWLIEELHLKMRPAKDYLRRLTKISGSLASHVGYDLFEMLGSYLNLDSIDEEIPLYEEWEEETADTTDLDLNSVDYLDIDEDDESDEAGNPDEVDLDEELDNYCDDPSENSWKSRCDELQRELDNQITEIFARFPQAAPTLVDDYIATYEYLSKDPKDFNRNLRVLYAFHDFIVDLSGSSCIKYLKKKPSCLPDEEAFKNWMVTEYRMDYKNVVKILSSVKRMDVVLPSLVSDPMSFLDVLRALPSESKRENYIKRFSPLKRKLSKDAGCAYKTIQNGFTNIEFYIKFLSKSRN